VAGLARFLGCSAGPCTAVACDAGLDAFVAGAQGGYASGYDTDADFPSADRQRNEARVSGKNLRSPVPVGDTVPCRMHQLLFVKS